MIEEEIPKDVSLLRCTLKKSQQVFAKIVLLVSYAIVVLSLLGCGYLLVTGILIPGVAPIVAAIVVGVLMIPWYYYVTGIAILAIPVYSFLWCIVRELTEEDWISKSARNSEVPTVLIGVSIVLAIILYILAPYSIPYSIMTPGNFFGMVLFLTISFLMFVFGIYVVCDGKILRFPGAVWHYYRRIK